MSRHRPTGTERYMNGIYRAAHNGKLAKMNCEPRSSNPYKQFEHRKTWEDAWDATDYDL